MYNKKEEEAIVLFSGGKDSFLTVCLLIEQGLKVNMITFRPCAGIGDENARCGADRIIEKYGKMANFLGVFPIAGIWREFVLPYFNMTPSEIISEFGEITPSQFNCLTCRSAMYVATIIQAREMTISIVGDGARKDQGFVIELPIMIERFQQFFLDFSISLKFPVLDLDSDWRLKNLLLARGFVPKVFEPQCLLGAPLPNNQIPSENIQEATEEYFSKIIEPRARQMIKDNFPLTTGDFI